MKLAEVDLPLHVGKVPSWLFKRMAKLARLITVAIVEEYGPLEVLKRLSDPYWFQAFGCILGFDWHSSGLTTTVCGALKEGLKGLQRDLGIYVAGGKGARSRKTPVEIATYCEGIGRDPQPLQYASRLSAKVDTSAVQDGYQLYHHIFLFTKQGAWCVVQQGMNPTVHYARRYHWFSGSLKDFVCEPHTAICCDRRGRTLNMVAQESSGSREIATHLSRQPVDTVLREFGSILRCRLPAHHAVTLADINPIRLHKILLKTYQTQPADFERLLGIEGVGPKTIRALALIGELLYGAKPSFRDPARFSFAHGGKDGHPYRLDREGYETSIQYLREAIKRAKLGRYEKLEILKGLGKLSTSALGP